MKKLFTPIKIGQLELKNRVVFPAMGTCMPTEDNKVTKQLINYHVARAKGGCGLNIVEVASVHKTSRRPNFLDVSDDTCIEGYLELTTAIHDVGGMAALQLWHFGALIPDPTGELENLAPSDFPPGSKDQRMAREMSKDDMNEIAEAYTQATIRSIRSGFDAVELHFGHGYIVSQFLSPNHNYRTDEYGGSLENRMRFPLEIVKTIRKSVGDSFPIIVRISAEEGTPNGYTLDDMVEFSKELEKAGVDAIDVSYGTAFGSVQYEVPPIDIEKGFNVFRAERIKEQLTIPVMTVGRINSPEQAEEILDNNRADIIGIGRGQLSDSEFCNKAFNNQSDEIVKCFACDQGCFDGFATPGQFVSCLRNPSCGREEEYEIQKSNEKKKILVVGGGPAGLESALVLQKRNHDVVLIEKTKYLGGQLRTAGLAPRKQEIEDAAIHMGELVKKSHVDLRMETDFSLDLLKSINPDDVVVAIGSEPIIPPIKGVALEHVKTSHKVLRGLESTKGNVLVIGGGLVGTEIAEYCAENNQQVTIVEMQDEIAKELGQLRKIMVMEHIEKHNMTTYLNSKCIEIKENSVVIERDNEEIVIDNIDTVVIAVGTKKSDSSKIVDACEELNIKTHIIGDAYAPRKAIDAIYEAAQVGRNI